MNYNLSEKNSKNLNAVADAIQALVNANAKFEAGDKEAAQEIMIAADASIGHILGGPAVVCNALDQYRHDFNALYAKVYAR